MKSHWILHVCSLCIILILIYTKQRFAYSNTSVQNVSVSDKVSKWGLIGMATNLSAATTKN